MVSKITGLSTLPLPSETGRHPKTPRYSLLFSKTPPLLLAQFENPEIQKSTRVASDKNRSAPTHPNFFLHSPLFAVELAFCRE